MDQHPSRIGGHNNMIHNNQSTNNMFGIIINSQQPRTGQTQFIQTIPTNQSLTFINPLSDVGGVEYSSLTQRFVENRETDPVTFFPSPQNNQRIDHLQDFTFSLHQQQQQPQPQHQQPQLSQQQFHPPSNLIVDANGSSTVMFTPPDSFEYHIEGDAKFGSLSSPSAHGVSAIQSSHQNWITGGSGSGSGSGSSNNIEIGRNNADISDRNAINILGPVIFETEPLPAAETTTDGDGAMIEDDAGELYTTIEAPLTIQIDAASPLIATAATPRPPNGVSAPRPPIGISADDVRTKLISPKPPPKKLSFPSMGDNNNKQSFSSSSTHIRFETA